MLKNVNTYYGEITNKFFKEVSNKKPLSKEEEILLIKDYRFNGNVKSLHELVNRNQKYLIQEAKKYLNKSNLTLGELINEASVGLIKAIEKYDINCGLRLLTYGTFWIKESIFKSLNDNSRFVRLPTSKIKKMSKEKDSKEPIIINNIDDYYSIDNDEFNDNFIDEIEYDLGDSEIYTNLLKNSFNVLDAREKYIIESYFGYRTGKKNTLEEIGIALDLSKQRVRLIKIKALRKLRSELIGLDII